jgi:hypothetical protein
MHDKYISNRFLESIIHPVHLTPQVANSNKPGCVSLVCEGGFARSLGPGQAGKLKKISCLSQRCTQQPFQITLFLCERTWPSRCTSRRRGVEENGEKTTQP